MMGHRRCRRAPLLCSVLAATMAGSALGSGSAAAQFIITEIIDATGDGAGNGLVAPGRAAVDAAGNVYVAGPFSDNVFKITPAGVITQIVAMIEDVQRWRRPMIQLAGNGGWRVTGGSVK